MMISNCTKFVENMTDVFGHIESVYNFLHTTEAWVDVAVRFLSP